MIALTLPGAAFLTATTMVQLNPTAAPGTADPAVTNVSVTGRDFPTGTIPPANVTVTLDPTTPGGGPSSTTAAVSVQIVSGSTERVWFRVPRSINVVAPTSYQVSISGTTSTGNAFQSGNSSTLTVNPNLLISSKSPLATGTVGVNYFQTLAAAGGSGGYSWSVASGELPAGLSLSAATGQITGQPNAAGISNFTIEVTDSTQGTARKPFALTIAPPGQNLTVSPNSANAGLSLQVAIMGLYTNFVQGTTQASFGPGTSVGGGPEGQPGPVTVNSATSAIAQISIDAVASTGPHTVTVTTGGTTASLADGFNINAAIPFITVNTSAPTAIAPNFSGFADEYLLTGVEYNDPKYLPLVQAMHPGFVRYPSGLPSMAFDWQSGHMNNSWISQLQPKVNSTAVAGMNYGLKITQAKGGACFVPGSCFADYAAFVRSLGGAALIDFNGWSDSNTNSAGNMVAAAQANGLNVIAWELANEPYVYPLFFPTAASYASFETPYGTGMTAADPNASVGVFYQGAFSFIGGNYRAWDNGIAAYTPKYWKGALTHIYPITQMNMTAISEEQTLNGILAHGTADYISSYLAPLVGPGTPIYITEMNSDAFATMPFESYLYNGIFLAEYVARMSTSPYVKAVAIQPLYLGNNYNQGILRSVNDYETYLLTQVTVNPNFSTNTATNPNTQFQFYYSANALCLTVLNLAVNNSIAVWPTTVNGGPTVPILGYDGQPIPAVFAQAYRGTNGTHYLVVTNKSGSTIQIALEVNGNLLQRTVNLSYVSNSSDTAENTATSQNNLQIVSTTSSNPLTIGPYSVNRIQW